MTRQDKDGSKDGSKLIEFLSLSSAKGRLLGAPQWYIYTFQSNIQAIELVKSIMMRQRACAIDLALRHLFCEMVLIL